MNKTLSNHYDVHRLTAAMPTLQQKYGLWIIGGGTGAVSPSGGFAKCPDRYFEYYSLSHMYDGGGQLTIGDGEPIILEPGDAVLMTPHQINRYGGGEKAAYIEDCLQFTGPVIDMMRNAGVICPGVYRLGQVRKLLPIIQLSQNPAAESQIKANITLQQLLVELYANARHSKLHTQIADLIEEIKKDPQRWWTVAEMAELCSLSCDQFRRKFLHYTGMNPKPYLEQLKIRTAANILLSETLPVAGVAKQLGYLDPFHFSRRFKKIIGVAPENYRKTLQP